jgi:hypothetical protein
MFVSGVGHSAAMIAVRSRRCEVTAQVVNDGAA